MPIGPHLTNGLHLGPGVGRAHSQSVECNMNMWQQAAIANNPMISRWVWWLVRHTNMLTQVIRRWPGITSAHACWSKNHSNTSNTGQVSDRSNWGGRPWISPLLIDKWQHWWCHWWLLTILTPAFPHVRSSLDHIMINPICKSIHLSKWVIKRGLR